MDVGGVGSAGNVTAPGTQAADPARAAKLERACREFESLFLGYLLKGMRAGTETLVPGEEDAGSGLVTELVDENLARALAEDGGLGLAEMLESRLAPRAGLSAAAADATQSVRPVRGLVRWVPATPDPARSSGVDRLQAYEPWIRQAAEANGLSPALLRAVILKESGGRADAVSQKGAKGLMQLMDGTARDLGVKDAFDPRDNILAGARYLRGLIDRWRGNLRLALASYNAGPSAVEKFGDVPPYPETQAYVRDILGRLGRSEGATVSAIGSERRT